MFVPRSLRLKGTKEPAKPRPATAKTPEGAATQDTIPSEDVRTEGDANPLPVSGTVSGEDVQMEKVAPNSLPASDTVSGDDVNMEEAPNPLPATKRPDIAPGLPGSRFAALPITPEFFAQLIIGMEMIFSDYAHQHWPAARWLKARHRTVDGEQSYVHLSAILEHNNIASLKPQPTQLLLQRALRESPSTYLEISQNGYHVRRKPSTFPLSWVPADGFSVTDDNGLHFWDQRTIYVEPHIRHLCKTPAKVAHWLKEHGDLRQKWLPIQAVHTIENSCAFVVLSGNVLHADIWAKWRDGDKPKDWRIMTKVENKKREAEYLALLHQNRVITKRKRGDDDDDKTPTGKRHRVSRGRSLRYTRRADDRLVGNLENFMLTENSDN